MSKSGYLANYSIMQSTDIQVYGPGLCSGVLDTFKGEFFIIPNGGPGTINVRIHGPKGCFKVDISQDHPMRRIVTVRYNPTSVGEYTIDVHWCDIPSSGSSFNVYVASSARDLQQWMNNRNSNLEEEFGS